MKQTEKKNENREKLSGGGRTGEGNTKLTRTGERQAMRAAL